MVYGESGVLPISITVLANAFAYYHRVTNMSNVYLAKRVFDSLSRISVLGSHNWITWVQDEARKHGIELQSNMVNKKFKKKCIATLSRGFKEQWHHAINDPTTTKNRLYSTIKISFQMEPYLRQIQNVKHRVALTRLRCSSHHLAIETGRWRKPPVPTEERRCQLCRIVEDEYHLVVQCARYSNPRAELNNSLFSILGEEFVTFKLNLFNNVLTSQNAKVQRAFAKFLSKAFNMHASQ